MISKNWNVEKFEAQLKKEVEHRKHYQRRSSPILVLDFLLFDQFLLVGLPPDAKRDDPPEILFAYPPFQIPEIPLDNITDYCFPTGVDRQFLQKNKGHFLQDEFVFSFKSRVRPVFGVCVHVNPKYEPTLPFYAGPDTKDTTFCFCLLTATPCFSSHFSFLTYLALWTVGKLKEPQVFDEEISVEMPQGVPIPGLDLTHQNGHHPLLEVPVQFENEIANYYTSPLMSPPVRYSSDLELRFPTSAYVENEKSIMWATWDTLFSILTPADIVTIIGGLHLDAQVLIIGKSLHEVTSAVHALVTLIKPFTFQGNVIPILPVKDEFMELLNSPTPFIIGCPPSPRLNKFSFLDSCIIVDLDKRSVPPDAYYPQYPSFQKVVSGLTGLLSQKTNTEEHNPFGFPQIFGKYLSHKYSFPMTMVDKIFGVLQQPFTSILSEFLQCFFVTDMSASDSGVTVFNQELFIAQAPEEDKQFFEMLIDSQTFREYVEDRISIYMKEKGEVPDRKRRSSFKNIPNKPVRKRARTKSIYVSADEASEIIIGDESEKEEPPNST